MHTEDNLPKQRKIVDYKIAGPECGVNIDVINFINDGYELYGNPFSASLGDQYGLFQAMVKYED